VACGGDPYVIVERMVRRDLVISDLPRPAVLAPYVADVDMSQDDVHAARMGATDW